MTSRDNDLKQVDAIELSLYVAAQKEKGVVVSSGAVSIDEAVAIKKYRIQREADFLAGKGLV